MELKKQHLLQTLLVSMKIMREAYRYNSQHLAPSYIQGLMCINDIIYSENQSLLEMITCNSRITTS